MRISEIATTENKTREDWKAFVKWANDKAESDAIEEFKSSPAASRLRSVDSIFGYIAMWIKSIRAGNAPEPMRYDIADEIALILSTPMWTECECCYFKDAFTNNPLPDEVLASGDPKAVLNFGTAQLWTEPYGLFCQMAVALADYLREAAAFAKSLGFADVALKFLVAWRRVHPLCGECYWCLDWGVAEDLLAKIRDASDLLWAEMEFARLEPPKKEG